MVRPRLLSFVSLINPKEKPVSSIAEIIILVDLINMIFFAEEFVSFLVKLAYWVAFYAL
jgi:hypothetical protein